MLSDDTVTILHVDDDDRFLDLTQTFLSRVDEDLDVVTHSSVETALDTVERRQVDCVVSDYDMPEMTGLEFYERLRVDHDVPFVLYTGKGSEEIASEAISAGVDDYIRKGTGIDTYELLANRVRNLVRKRRAERRVEQVFEAVDLMTEGVSLVDEDDTFVHVNRRFASIFDYDPGELIGRHWSVLYHEDDVPRIQEVLCSLSRTEVWCGQTRQRRSDGTTIRTRHTLSRTSNGLLVCLVRDPLTADEADSATA